MSSGGLHSLVPTLSGTCETSGARRLTAFTHFAGQPIGFLFKGQATLLHIFHEPTPRCTALIQKLTVTQLIKKFHFHNSSSVDATLSQFNPLTPELNRICYLLALLAHHFPHVSRIRVKSLTLRLLMLYIYMTLVA